MNLNITINIDDNYMQHAMAMLCSLYESNSSHTISLYVLSNSLSDDSKDCLNCITEKYNNFIFYCEVDESRLQGVKFRQERPLTMAAYYRLLLSDVLPSKIDKVLYLDCDLIVLGDLQPLFEIDLSNYALAATLDDFPLTYQHRVQLNMEADQKTFCSGVMLVNLEYWRKNGVTEKLLQYAKKEKPIVYFHDQDVLNFCFKKSWFLLSPKWNRIATDTKVRSAYLYRKFDLEEYFMEPIIIHYANLHTKPWMAASSPCKRYYIKYLNLSGFQNVKFKKSPLMISTKLFLILIKYNVIILFRKLFRCYS